MLPLRTHFTAAAIITFSLLLLDSCEFLAFSLSVIHFLGFFFHAF